jgi:hypothetical protein
MARLLLQRLVMDEVSADSTELRGSTVRFRVADVVMPPPDELLQRLFGDDLLEGRVVEEAKGDEPMGAHVAVSIGGLSDPVVVLRSQLISTRRST